MLPIICGVELIQSKAQGWDVEAEMGNLNCKKQENKKKKSSEELLKVLLV